MKYLLLLSLAVSCTACAINNDVPFTLGKTQVQPYAGTRSYQANLLGKVKVVFDTTIYAPDVVEEIEGGLTPLLVYNEWENHAVYYVHLEEDRPTIAANQREHLLKALSASSIHQQIDSLEVYLTELEVIIPYSAGGQFLPLFSPGAVDNQRAVGPSRVSMQLFYQCYHDDLVTENLLSNRIVIPIHHANNTPGGERYISEYHVQQIYDSIDEMLDKFGEQISTELEGVL